LGGLNGEPQGSPVLGPVYQPVQPALFAFGSAMAEDLLQPRSFTMKKIDCSADTIPAVFNFKEVPVRTQEDEKGRIWFCAKDVCDILGYTNSKKAIADHCRKDGVTNRYPIVDTLGRQQFPTFINEGNLYRLITRSKMPEAEKFELWIFDEVIPTIRRTGRYAMPGKNMLLALEGEIKEGASLLSQVIGTGELQEGQKWQLVDRLLTELFGVGTALLLPDQWPHQLPQQPTGRGPGAVVLENEYPLLGLKLVGGGRYRVFMHPHVIYDFVRRCCEASSSKAASQETIYHLFRNWFGEAFNHPPPTFAVLHDALLDAGYRSITLVGEPWFVGLCPKEVRS